MVKLNVIHNYTIDNIMSENGFGKSCCKGSPIQPKVSQIALHVRVKFVMLLLRIVVWDNVISELTPIILMIDSIMIFYGRNAVVLATCYVLDLKFMAKTYSNIILRAKKNNDVTMNGNDFHGSVALGAQTVPEPGHLDESCGKYTKTCDLHKYH